MKKLLSLIVAAGFLAGVGCGDATTVKKEKETKTVTSPGKEKTTTTTEKNEKKPADK